MFVYVLVLNAISGAASMTVVGKRPVGSVHRFKVTAPEVYVNVPPQLHRVATPTAAALQDRLHGVRIPKHRQKHRYYVKRARPVVYPVVVTQRQRPPPPPQRPLASNELSEAKEDNDHEASFPPESGESFPSFGRDSPYLQSIRKPTPETALVQPSEHHEQEPTFTPVQMYLQIRQTNQVKHVPQSEAVKDATTLEEVVNAPRLKELLRTTRVREVYSEEGYEDAGYDHGGHIRHAEHDEGYAAKDEGLFKLKGKVEEEDYTVPEETKKKQKVSQEAVPQESKLEPKISRSEVTGVEYATLPAKYKGEHKYSSKIRRPEITTESFWAVPTVFETIPTSTSPMGYDVITFPTDTDRTTSRSKYIKIISTSEEPGKTQKTNSTGKDLKKRNKGFKYSRLHAKYPKRDRFRLAKLATTTDNPEENDDGRIILPTIGYINSLTTAHFGKEKTPHVGSNNLLTKPLNLSQALSYMRANKQKRERRKLGDPAPETSFESRRIKNRSKREVEVNEEDIPDDGEEIHEQKNEEIEEEERLRSESEEEEHEKELREELDREEEEIIGATLGRYGPKVLSEESREQLNPENSGKEVIYVTTTVKPVDTSKYPFYFSRQVNEDSPLRYATNPKNFPKKVGPGMVFYESREKLIQCPEMRPDLDDIPRKNSTLETEGDRQRLAGLGDKIMCLRSKYFDEDPLDNPLFKETEIDYVGRIKKGKDIVRDGRKASLIPKNLRYHSSYQYRPNGTLHIMVQGSELTANATERVIPVTENVDESPLQEYTRISGLTPPPIRRNHVRPTRSKMVVPHNCLHVIGKMAGLNGHKNLIIDCNDAMLIQEMRNDVRYLKIIPKIPEVSKRKVTSSDWVPITAYPTRFGRRADSKDADLYLITDLKEDEGVRRGEVVEDLSKRRKRATEETEKNLPLKLSLKEFFLLLQSNNQRNNFAPKPFQLPASTAAPKTFLQPKQTQKSFPKLFHHATLAPKSFQPVTSAPKSEESQEDDVVRIGGQYIKGIDGREMVYIKYDGVGRWVITQHRPKYSKKYKKYKKGKF
ncbi:UNVERIFIED_CONTAM: hypothetical protein PYX00_008974 [Menopon gallinae]|uniref:Uncharacterized protein n=1 Tax=Menopon gallinae TaxID=328185 RepID=A0AAW2H9N2_9NEOP